MTGVGAQPDPATLPVLRLGAEGDHVERLQQLLVADGADIIADGDWGPVTQAAVIAAQKRHGLKPDGVVGEYTWKALLDAHGAAADASAAWAWAVREDAEDAEEPGKPDFGPIVGNHGRQQVFGAFKYAPAPTAGNPEGIRFKDDWPDRNVITVTIPQLAQIPGITYQGKIVGAGPKSGHVQVHRLVAEQSKALWQAWEDAGLLDRILTWAGWWNPRFVRRSKTVLSNHAFATAFDINAPWNGFNQEPAKAGERGCVWDLVALAHEHGFYWGGHFRRKDGMHFEVAKVL